MRRKFRNKSARYFSTGKSMSVNKTPRRRANNDGYATWETSEFIDILLSNPEDDMRATEVVKQKESYGTTLVDVFKDSLHYDPSLNLDNVDWAEVIEFFEQSIEDDKFYHGASVKRASEAPFSNDQTVVNTALSFLNDRFGGQWNELRFWYRDDILEELEKYLSGHPAEGIIADVLEYLTYDMAFEEPQAIRDEMFPSLLTHALRHFGGSPSAAAEADESEIEEALYETLERFYYEDQNLYDELREKFFEHISKTSNLNTERKNAMNGRNRKSLAANRKTASSDFWSALDRWDDVVDIYVESNPNGSLVVSAMIGGYREHDVFFDYSVEEAVDIFADDHSLSMPVRGGFVSARRANQKRAGSQSVTDFLRQHDLDWATANHIYHLYLNRESVSDIVPEHKDYIPSQEFLDFLNKEQPKPSDVGTEIYFFYEDFLNENVYSTSRHRANHRANRKRANADRPDGWLDGRWVPSDMSFDERDKFWGTSPDGESRDGYVWLEYNKDSHRSSRRANRKRASEKMNYAEIYTVNPDGSITTENVGDNQWVSVVVYEEEMNNDYMYDWDAIEAELYEGVVSSISGAEPVKVGFHGHFIPPMSGVDVDDLADLGPGEYRLCPVSLTVTNLDGDGFDDENGFDYDVVVRY